MSHRPEIEATSMKPHAGQSRWTIVKAALRSTRSSSVRMAQTLQHVPAGAHTRPPVLRPELY